MTYPPFKHFTLMEQTPTTASDSATPTETCKRCGYLYEEHILGETNRATTIACDSFTPSSPTTTSDSAAAKEPEDWKELYDTAISLTRIQFGAIMERERKLDRLQAEVAALKEENTKLREALRINTPGMYDDEDQPL